MKVAIFVAALLLTATAAIADISDDVRCREIAFSASVEQQDAALFATFIDADARFVGNSALRGPADITTAWSVFFAETGPAIKWRPQFVEVLEDGKLALTRGPYRMTTSDENGVQTEHWGAFNSVWRLHEDGVWRVVFDTGSDSAEPPSAEVQALIDAAHSCKSAAD